MNITNETRDSCDGKCHFCGGTATGFWDGTVQRVEVCAHCSTTKMIQLVVDSLPRFGMDTAISVYERINAAYWRGVAARWQRENAPAKGDEP